MARNYYDRLIKDALDWSMLPGTSKRIKECERCVGRGNSRHAVLISRESNGDFHWWCFRCSRGGVFRTGGASPEQTIAMRSARKKIIKESTGEIVLPADFILGVPSRFKAPVLKAGLSDKHLDAFGVGFSDSSGRIIVPIYEKGLYSKENTGKLMGWIGRDVSNREGVPKWLIKQSHDYFGARLIWCSKSLTNYDDNNSSSMLGVVVEDCFSAMRVALCLKATENTATINLVSIALLTTSFPTWLIYKLKGLPNLREVIVWLDQDAYSKSRKHVARLNTFGIKARSVLSPKDPKEYSNTEIKEYLKL